MPRETMICYNDLQKHLSATSYTILKDVACWYVTKLHIKTLALIYV